MNSQFSDGDHTDVMRQGKRAAYSAPKLVEYGALREITLSVGTTGNSDGGGTKADNKTR